MLENAVFFTSESKLQNFHWHLAQGDQVVRIFVQLAIANYGLFLENCKTSPNF
jgi:hypothetical protein